MRTVSQDLKWMKRLVWAYYFLWIFEGALRKWLLPSLSDSLLLIRDPLVLALYLLAWKNGLFPRSRWLSAVGVFSVVCVVIGFLILPEAPVVVLYGYRSDFLHLALVFLLPKLLNQSDIRKIGYFTLLLAPLQTMIMVAQFSAPRDSWLNAGAGGGEGGQIESALGHIRPPGTFSFIVGASEFFAIVAAFLLYSLLTRRKQYPAWLLLLASVSLLSAAAVSGSRGFLVNQGVVFVAAIVAAGIVQPKLCLRLIQAAIVLAIAAYIASYLPFFAEGTQTLSTRIEGASAGEGGISGFTGRVTDQLTEPFNQWSEAPPLGYGIGAASNVGTRLLGLSTLSHGEGEWTRVISELGPLLGSIFLLFRFSLVLILVFHALRALRQRQNPLGFLFLGAVFPDLLVGTFGISTTLGFIVFLSGCSLAAAQEEQTSFAWTPMIPRPLRPAKRAERAPL